MYEAGKLPLAPGERIRITQNGQTKDGHRVNNGELRRVRKFTAEGDIVLDNGWVLDKNFGNLAHGYCVTSHSSQGKTIQRLLVAESEASLPAASREQFYVSASRGVEAIKIYTDNKDALMDAVAVSGERPAATDLAKGTLLSLIHISRPVKGIPDPHLHAHCFAFNATWDNVEQRWKAGEFGDLKRDAPYYEACLLYTSSKKVIYSFKWIPAITKRVSLRRRPI